MENGNGNGNGHLSHDGEVATNGRRTIAVNRTDTRAMVPELGYREYWQPVMLAKKINPRRPTKVRMMGEDLVVFRDGPDGVGVLQDLCSHRGARLSVGKCDFDGTVTCPYHGGVFDAAGNCRALVTEGPDSTFPGKERNKVRAYPARIHSGIVWAYMGEMDPPPLEEDLFEELLDPTCHVFESVQEWECDWRTTLDNPGDSHPFIVHRYSFDFLFYKMPAFGKVKTVAAPSGKGVGIWQEPGEERPFFEGLGHWPRTPERWRVLRQNYMKRGKFTPTSFVTELRLPGISRVDAYGKDIMFTRWAVPIEPGRTRNFLFAAIRPSSPLQALRKKLRYHLVFRWATDVQFIGQDRRILENMDYQAPENLSALDIAMLKWRRLSAQARGNATGTPADDIEALVDDAEAGPADAPVGVARD